MGNREGVASPSLLGPAPSCVSASVRMNVGVLVLWLLGCGKAILGREAFLGSCPSSHVGDKNSEYFAESFPIFSQVTSYSNKLDSCHWLGEVM